MLQCAKQGFAMEAFADEAGVERAGLGLIGASLPREEWTHAAHFAAVLWLLRRDGAAVVAHEIPGLIRAYNEEVGGVNSDTEGYHETITQASIRAAANMLAMNPDAPLHEVLRDLMATSLGRSDWLLAYWNKDALFSVEARRGWVEPDLAPLPF
jgi:hypothetical protein